MAGNSESVKRSEQTKKDKYGPDYHARIGAVGGSKRKRGYLGHLKDAGRIEELKDITSKAAKKSNKVQGIGKGSRASKVTVSERDRDTNDNDPKELW
jgi:hypothetical protein